MTQTLRSRADASREQLRKEAERAYSLRSKLAHGSLSPKSDQIYEGVRLGAKLCELSLVNALAMFGLQGLRAEKLTRSEVVTGFQTIIAHADRLTALGQNAAAGAETGNRAIGAPDAAQAQRSPIRRRAEDIGSPPDTDETA